MMADRGRWFVNDDVSTPLGKGVVQGWMRPSEDAEPLVLVRLKRPGETARRCVTPRAQHSSLWLFDPDALERAR